MPKATWTRRTLLSGTRTSVLYPKPTTVDAFANGYKNGKEGEDLLKYYAQFHGDFKGIMSCVPLSEDEIFQILLYH